MKNNSSKAEVILLIISIVVTALPAFLCLLLLGDLFNFELKNAWECILSITISAAGVLGFFSLILRTFGVFKRSASKIVTAGLVIGLCAYLWFIYSILRSMDSRHIAMKDVVAIIIYLVPVIAVSLSLRNIFLRKNFPQDASTQ